MDDRQPRLPDFLVIGAARAGTTSLHRYLRQHPKVFMSARKETNYFLFYGAASPFVGPADRVALNPESVYSRQDYEALFRDAGDAQAVGESSPTYLDVAETACRIDETLPGVRLVASLRNPADRAYSDFKQMRSLGWEPESDFGSALGLEEERREAGWGPWYGYVRRGLYADRLAPFVERFGTDRLTVVTYEELASDPSTTLAEVLRALGLKWSDAIDVGAAHNSSPRSTRSRAVQRFLTGRFARRASGRLLPAGMRRTMGRAALRVNELQRPLDPRHRERLDEHFEPRLAELENLIGRDLSAWRS